MELIIEGIKLFASNFEERIEVNEPTGNELREISFVTSIIGESNQVAFSEILKRKSFIVEIPSKELIFKAKDNDSSFSYSYLEQYLPENTIYNYKVQLVELDKDLPDDWNFHSGQLQTIVMNWIRTRALSELLIEKGLITMKEYEDKIDVIRDRDAKKMIDLITVGKMMD